MSEYTLDLIFFNSEKFALLLTYVCPRQAQLLGITKLLLIKHLVFTVAFIPIVI